MGNGPRQGRTHAPEQTGALTAHAAWCVGVAAALLADGVAGGANAIGYAAFVTLALAPPVLAFAMRRRFADPPVRASLLLLWAGVAATSVAISGASDSAFAAWAVTPVAAALALGARRLAFEAAGLGVAGLAIAFALRLSGIAPNGGFGFEFGLLPVFGALAATVFLGVAAATASARDTRRVARAERGASKARAILDALPFAVMRVGADGVATDLAGAVKAVLSAEPERALGRPAADLIDARDRAAFIDLLDRARRFGETGVASLSSAGRVVELHVAPRGADDVLVVAALTPNDTESYAALRAERDAAVAKFEASSQFFAGLSHELRTPLNAILGFSEVIRTRIYGAMPEKYAEYVDIIHESATHLLDLIGSVLDLSKMDAGHYEIEIDDVDAAKAVDSALRLTRALADAKGIELRSQIGEGAETLAADAKALKQILLNLLSNAIKFTPENGRIDVRVMSRDGEQLVEVADTGCGIAADEVVSIGRPYEQTSSGKASVHQGTGLGLAIVRGLAELHGGRLEVESTVGRGTTMRVVLPAPAGAAPDHPGDKAGMDARARLEEVRKVDWGATGG